MKTNTRYSKTVTAPQGTLQFGSKSESHERDGKHADPRMTRSNTSRSSNTPLLENSSSPTHQPSRFKKLWLEQRAKTNVETMTDCEKIEDQSGYSCTSAGSNDFSSKPQLSNLKQQWDALRDIPRGKVSNYKIDQMINKPSAAVTSPQVKRLKQQWDAHRDIPVGVVANHELRSHVVKTSPSITCSPQVMHQKQNWDAQSDIPKGYVSTKILLMTSLRQKTTDEKSLHLERSSIPPPPPPPPKASLSTAATSIVSKSNDGNERNVEDNRCQDDTKNMYPNKISAETSKVVRYGNDSHQFHRDTTVTKNASLGGKCTPINDLPQKKIDVILNNAKKRTTTEVSYNSPRSLVRPESKESDTLSSKQEMKNRDTGIGASLARAHDQSDESSDFAADSDSDYHTVSVTLGIAPLCLRNAPDLSSSLTAGAYDQATPLSSNAPVSKVVPDVPFSETDEKPPISSSPKVTSSVSTLRHQLPPPPPPPPPPRQPLSIRGIAHPIEQKKPFKLSSSSDVQMEDGRDSVSPKAATRNDLLNEHGSNYLPIDPSCGIHESVTMHCGSKHESLLRLDKRNNIDSSVRMDHGELISTSSYRSVISHDSGSSAKMGSKESVAERRRKRALAASLVGAPSQHPLSPVILPKKGADFDNIINASSMGNGSTAMNEPSSTQISSAPTLVLEGYSDDDDSDENDTALFSGSGVRLMPKGLLKVKNMIRRNKLPSSKSASLHNKTTVKSLRGSSTSGRYTGKYSAEIIVDRTKLPELVQKVSRSPPTRSKPFPPKFESSVSSERISNHTNNTMAPICNGATPEKQDRDSFLVARNAMRRKSSSDSPTKQLSLYGSSGFDLYHIRDDDESPVDEEVLSHDDSNVSDEVSEMTNPSFFSQVISMGPLAQMVERGATPSESESSIDQSESATPLIGAGTMQAPNELSHGVVGSRDIENSNDDVFSSNCWNVFSSNDFHGNELSYDPFTQSLPHSVSGKDSVDPYTMTDSNTKAKYDKPQSLEQNFSFGDPPLDSVAYDSESESVDEDEEKSTESEECIKIAINTTFCGDEAANHSTTSGSPRDRLKLNEHNFSRVLDGVSSRLATESSSNSATVRSIDHLGVNLSTVDVNPRGKHSSSSSFKVDLSKYNDGEHKIRPSVTIEVSKDSLGSDVEYNQLEKSINDIKFGNVGYINKPFKGDNNSVVPQEHVSPNSITDERSLRSNRDTSQERHRQLVNVPFDEFPAISHRTNLVKRTVSDSYVSKSFSNKPFDEGDDDDEELCKINTPSTYLFCQRADERSPTPIISSRSGVRLADSNCDDSSKVIDSSSSATLCTTDQQQLQRVVGPNFISLVPQVQHRNQVIRDTFHCTAAAIKIQSEVRRILARHQAEDRMWALLVIQSYFRRWLAELDRYRYLYAVTRIQSCFRGWVARDFLDYENFCATLIQKHIRGYLATMSVYEALYNITIVQSLARRRKAVEQSQARLASIIFIQSCYRSFKVRRTLLLRNVFATKIQAAWRGFTAHLVYQFSIIDVIIVQSLVRRRKAINHFKATLARKKNDVATLIQATWRRYRCWITYHRDLDNIREGYQRAATRIQSAWRRYTSSMNYIQVIIDVLIVQSIIRRWLVIKSLKACPILVDSNTRLRPAVLIIQNSWRRRKARQLFFRNVTNIIITQSIVRRKLALERFRQLKFNTISSPRDNYLKSRVFKNSVKDIQGILEARFYNDNGAHVTDGSLVYGSFRITESVGFNRSYLCESLENDFNQCHSGTSEFFQDCSSVEALGKSFVMQKVATDHESCNETSSIVQENIDESSLAIVNTCTDLNKGTASEYEQVSKSSLSEAISEYAPCRIEGSKVLLNLNCALDDQIPKVSESFKTSGVSLKRSSSREDDGCSSLSIKKYMEDSFDISGDWDQILSSERSDEVIASPANQHPNESNGEADTNDMAEPIEVFELKNKYDCNYVNVFMQDSLENNAHKRVQNDPEAHAPEKNVVVHDNVFTGTGSELSCASNIDTNESLKTTLYKSPKICHNAFLCDKSSHVAINSFVELAPNKKPLITVGDGDYNCDRDDDRSKSIEGGFTEVATAAIDCVASLKSTANHNPSDVDFRRLKVIYQPTLQLCLEDELEITLTDSQADSKGIRISKTETEEVRENSRDTVVQSYYDSSQMNVAFSQQRVDNLTREESILERLEIVCRHDSEQISEDALEITFHEGFGDFLPEKLEVTHSPRQQLYAVVTTHL